MNQVNRQKAIANFKRTKAQLARQHEKSRITKQSRLTLKEKIFVTEFLKTGNATHAARVAYPTATKMSQNQFAYTVKQRPRVKNKIEEALRKMELTEDFAVTALKSVISAGEENRTDAKPADALKGLELFFKLKGYLGNQKQTLKVTLKDKAQNMSAEDIKKELKKLDAQQQRLFSLMKNQAEDGEIL